MDVKGNHCLVSWDKVCLPKRIGSLGMPNLQLLNLALWDRWPWMERVVGEKPWEEFNMQVLEEAATFFYAAMKSTVGERTGTLFW